MSATSYGEVPSAPVPIGFALARAPATWRAPPACFASCTLSTVRRVAFRLRRGVATFASEIVCEYLHRIRCCAPRDVKRFAVCSSVSLAATGQTDSERSGRGGRAGSWAEQRGSQWSSGAAGRRGGLSAGQRGSRLTRSVSSASCAPCWRRPPPQVSVTSNELALLTSCEEGSCWNHYCVMYRICPLRGHHAMMYFKATGPHYNIQGAFKIHYQTSISTYAHI